MPRSSWRSGGWRRSTSGGNLGRPNDWLEEYYFLLACYGVYTGRFENLQPRERVAALLSSGVAAARLSWPRSTR